MADPTISTYVAPTPSLRECLGQAPDYYLASLPTTGQAGVPEDIASYLLDRQNFTRIYHTLGSHEQAAFWVIATYLAGRGIPVELCWDTLTRLTGGRYRRFGTVIDELRRRGLVFLGRQRYRTVYFIPGDLRALAMDVLFRPLVEKASLPPDALPPAPHQATALRDMHFLLSGIGKGELTLTQKGEIFRRQQVGLARRLGWPAKGYSRAKAVIREDHLALRLSLLWNYGISRDLFYPTGQEPVLSDSFEDWVLWEMQEKLSDMAAYAIEEALSWQVDIFFDLEAVLLAPADHWVCLDSIASAPGLPGPHSQEATEGRLKGFLQRLVYLGILEAADSAREAYRLTPTGRIYLDAFFHDSEMPEDAWPESEASFIVAPNYEVVVPSTVDGFALLWLDMVSDLKHADHAMVFEISRGSVYRALRNGMTVEGIIGHLHTSTPHGLPQNVEASIRQWGASYGQIWFARYVLLRCASPALAQELKASPRISPYVLGEVTPCDLIVPETAAEKLRQLLEKEGYLPRAGIEVAPNNISSDSPGPAHDDDCGGESIRHDLYEEDHRQPAAIRHGARHPLDSPRPTLSHIQLVTSDWPDLDPPRRR